MDRNFKELSFFMGYEHLIVYYFSGTGNARKSAEWIAETGRQRGLKVNLINIDRFEGVEVPETKGKTLIGFCSPTHGFNLPPIMLKYMARFPRRKDTDVFLLNTRAGMKLWKGFLPGLSGLAQFFPALMFLFKGYRIVGMQPVDLPSNWLILHPGLRKKVVLSLFKRHKRIVTQFADRMLSGRKKYQAFWSLPFDLAVAPVSLGYYFIGRFFLSKTLVATKKCDLCMLCIKNCPVQAIKLVNGRPYWTYKCESCMRCVNQCPERAIETAQSFTAFIIYISVLINSLVFSGWIVKNDLLWVTANRWWQETLAVTVSSIIMVVLIFSAYRILHVLMAYSWFNHLIAFTSLSKYRWWRRYQPNKTLKGIKY